MNAPKNTTWHTETVKHVQHNFKRYAQVPPSPNDSGMHWHARSDHGAQCAGQICSRRCRGRGAGQNGQDCRGEASSLSISHSHARLGCASAPAHRHHRPHGASQAHLFHAHKQVAPVVIRVSPSSARPCLMGDRSACGLYCQVGMRMSRSWFEKGARKHWKNMSIFLAVQTLWTWAKTSIAHKRHIFPVLPSPLLNPEP